jgi:ElaB/YqjD/DUF883 family membrane-anchored ribosome-binding protein
MEKKEELRQKFHNNIDAIFDKAESVSESSMNELHNLKQKAMLMRENTDNYIRQNPETSVLIAAGAGMAIGALVVAIFMRKH